jgi:hypothetical protein
MFHDADTQAIIRQYANIYFGYIHL